MGNYISKVTPVRPVFGKKLDESNTIVGEEIHETPNQSDLNQEQPNNSKDSINVDNLEQSPDNEEEDEQADGLQANGSHTNGFTNGQSNGQSNGHSNGHQTNGHSISKENGDQAEDELNEEEELNGESNGKLSKSDLKNKKADKSYSNKKASLINEVDLVESQQDEEIDNFEVVGRKRKGRKATTPKKQYKKRKNNLLTELEKVNELAVDQ